MGVREKLKAVIGKLKIDPQKPLHHHLLFWIPTVFFGALSLCAGISTSEFGLEHLAYPKRTMDALAYPIFVFSIALPLILAIGRFHASAQRAQSIRISNSTMSFKHYFDHRDAFIEYSRLHQTNSKFIDIRIVKPFLLYELYYPNSEMNRFDLTPSNTTFDLIEERLQKVIEKVDGIQNPIRALSIERVANVFEPFGIVIDFNVEKLKAKYRSGLEKDTQPMVAIVVKILDLFEHLGEFDRNNRDFAQSINKKLSDELQFFAENNECNNKIRGCLNQLILEDNIRYQTMKHPFNSNKKTQL